MKKYYHIPALIILLIFSNSCEKILDENPPSSISINNFYKTEADAITGLYGAYDELYGYYESFSLLYGEMNADDMVVSPVVFDRFQWDEFTYNTDVTNDLWANSFSGINRTNEVILYTGQIEMDANRKADIIAEAKALRALYYFHLVRTIGGVPLYETPTLNFNDIKAPRATEDEIYNLIIKDLTEAANELEDTSETGRINSDIANALLARVFLYRNDYTNALIHATNVINSGRYALFPDYAAIFKPENDNGIEHIFQVQYLSGESNNPNPDRFGPRIPPGPFSNSFWAGTIVNGSYAPSQEFIAQNPPSYRRDVTIANSYEHIDGVSGTITMEEVFGGIFPFYISKFDDRAAELQSGLNFPIIRYADILLIAAEALNEIDPGDNEKYNLINQVRERARNGVIADLPDLTGLSQEEFRLAVLEERRFELAFEGQRAWDLKRRNLFLSTLRAQGKTVEDFKLLFPVPDTQIDLNPNLEQNPGWD